MLDGQGRVLEANDSARRFTPELVTQLAGSFVDTLRASRAGCTMTASADGASYRLEGAPVDDVLVVSIRELSRDVDPPRPQAPLGPVTASVIEELNDLLTPILIMSSRLVRELEGSSANMASVIHTGATLAAALTRDVLALARPRFPFVERVDVNDAVREVKPLVVRLLGADVDVVLELADGLGESTLDRRRLEHALLNLIVNARDSLGEGGRVTISSALVEYRGRSRILLAVSDDGRGMTEEARLRALEGDRDAARIGIGIAAVHRFVRDCGGELVVESAPGKGTTVKMFFERACAEQRRAIPVRKKGGGETVLVADRDERIRWSMRLVLESEGYVVLLASTQESALALAASTPFDVAVVDDRILSHEPRAFLQRLRARAPQHRLVFMTDAVRTDTHGGAVAVLTKAFSGDDLLREVRRVLDGAASHPS